MKQSQFRNKDYLKCEYNICSPVGPQMYFLIFQENLHLPSFHKPSPFMQTQSLPGPQPLFYRILCKLEKNLYCFEIQKMFYNFDDSLVLKQIKCTDVWFTILPRILSRCIAEFHRLSIYPLPPTFMEHIVKSNPMICVFLQFIIQLRAVNDN